MTINLSIDEQHDYRDLLHDYLHQFVDSYHDYGDLHDYLSQFDYHNIMIVEISLMILRSSICVIIINIIILSW